MVVVIILSSLLNAIYFFRVIEQAYLKKAPVAERENLLRIKSLNFPQQCLVPIVVFRSLHFGVVGILNEPLVSNILLMAFPGGGLLMSMEFLLAYRSSLGNFDFFSGGSINYVNR